MLNPPIGNERHGLAYRAPGLANGLQLGDACRRFEPGAAAAARANADLDTIDAQRLQEARSFCGPNIATDQGCRLEPLPEAFDRLLHDLRVAMGHIHQDDVGPGAHQLCCPLQVVAPDADRRADQQPPFRVGAGMGPLAIEDQVLLGDEPVDPAVGVDQGEFFEAMREQDTRASSPLMPGAPVCNSSTGS